MTTDLTIGSASLNVSHETFHRMKQTNMCYVVCFADSRATMAAGWRLLSLLLLHLSTPFSSANGAQVSDAFWQGRGICCSSAAAGAQTNRCCCCWRHSHSRCTFSTSHSLAQVGDQPYLWTFQAAAERAQISPNRSFEPAATTAGRQRASHNQRRNYCHYCALA